MTKGRGKLTEEGNAKQKKTRRPWATQHGSAYAALENSAGFGERFKRRDLRERLETVYRRGFTPFYSFGGQVGVEGKIDQD